MVLGFVALGCGVGGLVAVAALLTLGLGPIVALLIFWLGSIVATLAIAVGFVRSTVLMAVPEPATPPLTQGEPR